MDSLLTNFLLCEFTMNWDAMKNSVYLYKDLEGLWSRDRPGITTGAGATACTH